MPCMHCYTHEPCGYYAIIWECDGNLFRNLSSVPPTWLIKLNTAPPLTSKKSWDDHCVKHSYLFWGHCKITSLMSCLFKADLCVFFYHILQNLCVKICVCIMPWFLQVVFPLSFCRRVAQRHTRMECVSRPMLLSKNAHKTNSCQCLQDELIFSCSQNFSATKIGPRPFSLRWLC